MAAAAWLLYDGDARPVDTASRQGAPAALQPASASGAAPANAGAAALLPPAKKPGPVESAVNPAEIRARIERDTDVNVEALVAQKLAEELDRARYVDAIWGFLESSKQLPADERSTAAYRLMDRMPGYVERKLMTPGRATMGVDLVLDTLGMSPQVHESEIERYQALWAPKK